MSLMFIFISCISNENPHQDSMAVADSIQANLEPPPAVKIPENYQPKNVPVAYQDSVLKEYEVASVNSKTETIKAKKPKQKLPNIKFKELVFDFGNINEGDVINHNFYFTNTGNSPLEIKKVKASCGCTAPSYPFIAIAPGEEGYIGVRYNSVGKNGNQEADIEVTSNGQPKTTMLYLRGIVQEKENLQADSTNGLD